MAKKKCCVIREYPEDWQILKELGEKLKLPYFGIGASTYGLQLLQHLLKRKRKAADITHGQGYICGAPSTEIHHEPSKRGIPG